jgi:hypothetical protein
LTITARLWLRKPKPVLSFLMVEVCYETPFAKNRSGIAVAACGDVF